MSQLVSPGKAHTHPCGISCFLCEHAVCGADGCVVAALPHFMCAADNGCHNIRRVDLVSKNIATVIGENKDSNTVGCNSGSPAGRVLVSQAALLYSPTGIVLSRCVVFTMDCMASVSPSAALLIWRRYNPLTGFQNMHGVQVQHSSDSPAIQTASNIFTPPPTPAKPLGPPFLRSARRGSPSHSARSMCF